MLNSIKEFLLLLIPRFVTDDIIIGIDSDGEVTAFFDNGDKIGDNFERTAKAKVKSFTWLGWAIGRGDINLDLSSVKAEK